MSDQGRIRTGDHLDDLACAGIILLAILGATLLLGYWVSSAEPQQSPAQERRR